MHCISVVEVQTRTVTKIVITEDKIVACSQDCSIVVITIGLDGSLLLSNILQAIIRNIFSQFEWNNFDQGHVSRVRCLSVDGDQILSGSDDRKEY